MLTDNTTPQESEHNAGTPGKAPAPAKRRAFWAKHGFSICYGLLLFSFTVYAVCDAFLIPHRYTTAISPDTDTLSSVETIAMSAETEQLVAALSAAGENTHHRRAHTAPGSRAAKADNTTAAEDAAPAADTAVQNPISVSSDSSVSLSQYRYCDTNVYVADVILSSPEDLNTAFAEDTYGRNIKAATSAIADAHDALLAVNGDFYGTRNDGYVIRNGVLYRSTSAGNEDLAIYADGDFRIVHEDDFSAEQLLADGALQVFSFGPALLSDGEILVDAQDEVGRAKASNPRTAIGMIEPLHYVFVVSDGRTDESEGLSLSELAAFMKELGVSTAYNLDGGGSSTMVYQGEVVNRPTTGGNTIKERSVSDIVYITE